jgi:parvulin-like peptidyl-prolyl isomerase
MSRRSLFALVLMLAVWPLSSWSHVIEEIVIKVNDSIITRTEYESRLKSTEAALRKEYKGPDLEAQIKVLPQKLLDQMEDELLLVEKAKQLYQVDMIVDHQLDDFMKENHLKTKADLAKALQAQGLTMAEFRKQITLIYVPEFMKSREIRSDISISTDEIKKYYDEHKNDLAPKAQVHLQEILILKSDHTKEQAEALADEIRKQYKAGTDFGELAEKYSEAFSRSKKGDAGWFTRGDLSPSIADAVFSLKAGSTTPDLVPTNVGWYIFRVEAVKEPDVPSLDQARAQIVEALKEEKFKKAYASYIKRLKAENYVWVNPKYV